MSYLNWKTWALTALLVPISAFAQVCTPRTANSSCLVVKDAQTGVELVSSYGEITPQFIVLPSLPSKIMIGYNHNDNLSNTQVYCGMTPIGEIGTTNVFTTFDITNCTMIDAKVVIFGYANSGTGSSFARLQQGGTTTPIPTPVATTPTATTSAPVATTPAPTPVAAAPAPALTYLTFDGYCDEIQFQQIPGSSTFYGTNSPNSCEAGALMFGYVLTGSDNKIHVTLSGGYADAAGNVNALKAVDLELVKADQTDISGNFSAFGIARDAGNRSATQITGQLNGTWKLDTTSRGSKTFATRSAVKPQKSIFSGM